MSRLDQRQRGYVGKEKAEQCDQGDNQLGRIA
jgi:hypothetical protein